MIGDNILILAPHCDDEVLGCGGAIDILVKEGKTVIVAIVTNGHIGAPELFKKEGTAKVRREAVNAGDFLGVKNVEFMDFPGPRLDSVPSYQISLAISELIKKYKINTLFIPHRGDLHKDHRISYEAALVAGRPTSGSTVKTILSYETLSETEWAAPFAEDAFIPTVYIDISESMNRKKEAFAIYTTQIRPHPHPRSLQNIESLAQRRGATVGMQYAEAFMLVRSLTNIKSTNH